MVLTPPKVCPRAPPDEQQIVKQRQIGAIAAAIPHFYSKTTCTPQPAHQQQSCCLLQRHLKGLAHASGKYLKDRIVQSPVFALRLD